MRQNVCRALAPSSRAASSTSSGTLASPARKITMKNPAEAQPEITEIVNNALPSFNMPGSTPTPALNKKPNTNPTTTIDNTAGEKNATRRKLLKRVFFSNPTASARPAATSNSNVQSRYFRLLPSD